jgi:ABC-type nitrate/sulfonate/bicarbonate transport system substrate-binding protein
MRHCALAITVVALAGIVGACQPAVAPASPPAAAPRAAPPAAPTAPAAHAEAPAPPRPALEKLTITTPSAAGTASLPLIAARDRGFFERNGFEVETPYLASDRAMAAVASGEVHYVAGVGTASVAASALGIPLRAVWYSATSPPYTLFSTTDIRTIDQVRGKRVGVPGVGGTSAMVTWLALRQFGIDSTRDLIILSIGNDELLLESLRNGSLDLAPLTPPTSLKARAEGFNPLLDIAAMVQMPLGGLSVSLEKLDREREQARRVVRALTQAKEWLLQDRAAAIDMLMDTLGIDRVTAEGTYDESAPTYRGHGLVTREGIENILHILREAGRVGPEVRYEDVAYPQLAEEVARELGLVP